MTTKAEKAEAIARLREWVKPGDTIYTTLESVSRSGMSRVIRLIKIEDNSPRYLAYNAHLAGIGSGFDRKRDGIKVGGCGMDMGYHLVYSLSRALWPDGFGCIGPKCPSNDHTNGDRNYTPHGDIKKTDKHHSGHVTHWHRDGGYCLKHRWL